MNKNIISITIILLIFNIIFIACQENLDSGDGGNNYTVVWTDDFESGSIKDEWWSDPWFNDGNISASQTISYEENWSGEMVSLGDEKWVGNQITVDVDYSEDAEFNFYYNVENLGEALFGIWDMDVSTKPSWKIENSEIGWDYKSYKLSKNSKRIWIGIVGGNEGDKVYIDEVEVGGSNVSVLNQN